MKGDNLYQAIADELDLLHQDIEALGAELCGDADFARRHMHHLQRLDEIGQRHNQLAQVLRATDPGAAARSVSLEALAGRLMSSGTPDFWN
ncbi:gustatory receptor family protein [Sphingomonas morindae]|uniref:Gustatory receptor family protein n=1 Tax=Sphingomonas morindae TaxID=1541170 RepID=A0ABY4X4A3_9SPHN|nr:gustatory receptor family protein [Sphingomonas morindae]USI71718.1 gustatory receptor family protein [Sphingomonas morindae]